MRTRMAPQSGQKMTSSAGASRTALEVVAGQRHRAAAAGAGAQQRGGVSAAGDVTLLVELDEFGGDGCRDGGPVARWSSARCWSMTTSASSRTRSVSAICVGDGRALSLDRGDGGFVLLDALHHGDLDLLEVAQSLPQRSDLALEGLDVLDRRALLHPLGVACDALLDNLDV